MNHYFSPICPIWREMVHLFCPTHYHDDASLGATTNAHSISMILILILILFLFLFLFLFLILMPLKHVPVHYHHVDCWVSPVNAAVILDALSPTTYLKELSAVDLVVVDFLFVGSAFGDLLFVDSVVADLLSVAASAVKSIDSVLFVVVSVETLFAKLLVVVDAPLSLSLQAQIVVLFEANRAKLVAHNGSYHDQM